MAHTVCLTSTSDQRSTDLAARLEQLLEQTDAETDDLSVRSLFELNEAADWAAGAPCPNCGSTVFSVMEVTEHLYESIEDEPGEYHLEYATHSDAIGPTLEYYCLECEQTIRGMPLGVLGVPASAATD
jgi:hypothetical protein